MTTPDPGNATVESGGSATAVRVERLSVRYGPIRSLDDISLTVRAGERVALVGPSGAGKSSLLNVLAGLVTPSTGTAEVLGSPLHRLSGRALRRHRSHVGVVGQDLHLALPLRVVHNVNAGALSRWSLARSVRSLVRPVESDDAAAVLESVGLADRLQARTDELSGGERQRVAVARVLRHRPALILADEPTSSVDPALSDGIMALLCPARRGPADATVMVSLHRPELARRHTDRTIGLRDGRVVFDRPSDAVDRSTLDGLYQAR